MTVLYSIKSTGSVIIDDVELIGNYIHRVFLNGLALFDIVGSHISSYNFFHSLLQIR